MNVSHFNHLRNYVKRAGIIPYMIHNQETYVLLGWSKEDNPVWADLGGRSEKDESVIETALREFGEESRHVLSIDLSRVGKVLITHTRTQVDSVIFFVNVDPTEKNININSDFQKTVPKNQYEDEMSYLQWIPYNTFLTLNNVSSSLNKVRKLL